MSTFIVGAIVFGIIAFAGYKTYMSRKNGGGCGGCSGCGGRSLKSGCCK